MKFESHRGHHTWHRTQQLTAARAIPVRLVRTPWVVPRPAPPSIAQRVRPKTPLFPLLPGGVDVSPDVGQYCPCGVVGHQPVPVLECVHGGSGSGQVATHQRPRQVVGGRLDVGDTSIDGQPPGRAHAVQAVVDSPGFIRGERGRDDVPLSAAGMFGLNTRSRAAVRGRRSLHALGWV